MATRNEQLRTLALKTAKANTAGKRVTTVTVAQITVMSEPDIVALEMSLGGRIS